MQACFFALTDLLPADGRDRGHQGLHRRCLREARRSDRRGQPGRRRPGGARAGAARASRTWSTAPAGDSPVVPATASDFVQRVTARDAERRRRSAPGQRPPARRHVPDRHRAGGEALDRGRDPDLGSRHLHRLRPVRGGVPPRRDPHEAPHARPRVRTGPRRDPARSRPSRSGPTTTPGCCSPSRSRPTTAPAVACASTCARRTRRAR